MLSFDGDLKKTNLNLENYINGKMGSNVQDKFYGKFGSLMLMHRVQKVYARGLFTLFICTSKFHTRLIYEK